ncbi:MAG: DUF2225 domain-containing protein, partial [Spirochaetales bacterium]|nr:DUF2225 domain-containing protein [Spirochaetales bacterium]
MKIPVFIAIGIVSTALISCGTFEVTVPGESKVIERNISEEYFIIAEAYKGQSNYTKAIEYYTLALKNKDLHDSAYYQIALCQVYSKNWMN